MRTDTQSVTIEVPANEVFEFLANPENLPRWAVGFCRNIRREGDGWVAETAQGDVGVRYVVDARSGVIDYQLSPAPGLELTAHSRVIPNGSGAEYVFTQLQPPGMSDAAFEGQVEALREELVVLRSVLKAQAACRAR